MIQRLSPKRLLVTLFGMIAAQNRRTTLNIINKAGHFFHIANILSDSTRCLRIVQHMQA